MPLPINHHSKGRLICDMKGGSGSCEGVMWFQSTGDATMCNGIGDGEVVDGGTGYIHMFE